MHAVSVCDGVGLFLSICVGRTQEIYQENGRLEGWSSTGHCWMSWMKIGECRKRQQRFIIAKNHVYSLNVTWV